MSEILNSSGNSPEEYLPQLKAEIHHLENGLKQERGNCLRSSILSKLHEDGIDGPGVGWALYSKMTNRADQVSPNKLQILLMSIPFAKNVAGPTSHKYNNIRILTNETFAGERRENDQILCYDFTLDPKNYAQHKFGVAIKKDISKSKCAVFWVNSQGHLKIKPGLKLCTDVSSYPSIDTNQMIYPFGLFERASDCLDSMAYAQQLVDSIRYLRPYYRSRSD